MTIQQAIDRLDEKKHNTYRQEEKVQWLSLVDAMISRDVIRTHQGGQDHPIVCYDSRTPLNTILLAPEPFDAMYLHFMEAQIDYHNAEYDRYNQSIKMFYSAYTDFVNNYNRTYLPVGKRFLYK